MSRSTRRPWIFDSLKRSKTIVKKKENRRYRKYVRQDLAQWRNRYYLYDGIYPGCAYCECMDDFWESDYETRFWRDCLSFDLEPAYDHPNRFRIWCNINGFRHYCDRPEYRRK